MLRIHRLCCEFIGQKFYINSKWLDPRTYSEHTIIKWVRNIFANRNASKLYDKCVLKLNTCSMLPREITKKNKKAEKEIMHYTMNGLDRFCRLLRTENAGGEHVIVTVRVSKVHNGNSFGFFFCQPFYVHESNLMNSSRGNCIIFIWSCWCFFTRSMCCIKWNSHHFSLCCDGTMG